MRAINIKNIQHLPIYYVLLWLLLLSCAQLKANEKNNLYQSLLNNAQKQQRILIEKYGVLDSDMWQLRCQKLMVELELHGFKQCLVLNADYANAYALAHGVVLLTHGLLSQMNNSDQLAHVLAHEHAHLELKHHQQAQDLINNPPTFFTKSRIKKFYRKIEHEADIAANQLLLEHNRDPLQIHHYWLRIEQANKKNDRKERSGDHNKLKNRIQRHNLPPELIDSW